MNWIRRTVVCLAAFVVLVVTAPAAHADLGDWWTQRQVTQNACGSGCEYDGVSGRYGDHSRVFFYTSYFGYDFCYLEFYIGHTYSIFNSKVTYCTTWSNV